MPTVDFTLSDVKQLVEASEQRMLSHMDVRFKEAYVTMAEMTTGVKDHMDAHFAEVERWFDRLEGVAKDDQRLTH
jgi:hypothetical protein